ncbi:dihydroorotate dehydrogenase electron transfer subunit [Melioribacter sp. OK-6-Me]|uniref:dihydroorotate dehydrogenase electron transfer subunit n=1 Tax=unclassified Melioribacter TaxID=2627329 RepID=UPI003EDA6596
MFTVLSTVESLERLNKNTFLLKVKAPQLATAIKPGQFCNIKVSDTDYPLLRRPFSVCYTDGDIVYFMFDIHGEGTRMLAEKKSGDQLDILGPLGNGFNTAGDYEVAVLIGGGIGVAPFPLLIKHLEDKEILTFVGARNSEQLIKWGMRNLLVATDDGSEGFNGNVIACFQSEVKKLENKKIRIFGCGPNPMLRALQKVAEKKYDCQLSIESAMACGFGICQGCPVKKSEGEGYYLVCKDGPVFNSDQIVIE